jgi:hypothetical protein
MRTVLFWSIFHAYINQAYKQLDPILRSCMHTTRSQWFDSWHSGGLYIYIYMIYYLYIYVYLSIYISCMCVYTYLHESSSSTLWKSGHITYTTSTSYTQRERGRVNEHHRDRGRERVNRERKSKHITYRERERKGEQVSHNPASLYISTIISRMDSNHMNLVRWSSLTILQLHTLHIILSIHMILLLSDYIYIYIYIYS